MVPARSLLRLWQCHRWVHTVRAAFIDGPRVSNPSWKLGCTSTFQTLEAAQNYCAHTACHALHDYDCDGILWRACPNATLEELQSDGDGTRACTKVPTPAATPSYVSGPRVDNQAFVGLCGAQLFGTGAAAQVACDADSACGAIHDYDCNGVGWRVCTTTVALQAAGPGTLACTEVKAAGPATPAAYTEGPRVDNAAHEGNCGLFFDTVGEAQAACDADPLCEALHDYACNGQGWRVCTTVAALEEAGPGTGACTQVPTSTGAPNATLEYIDGPRVANAAYVGLCSTAFYDDIAEAQALCAADPLCKAIHDYDCNGNGWRVCGSLEALQQAGPGSQACTQVPTTAYSAAGYVQGPRVGNMAWPSLCGTATHTLAEAVERCSADPDCAALHDYDCDSALWRVCATTIETLMAAADGSEACTQIPAAAAGYEEGPRVSNEAWPTACSDAYYTLEAAESLCSADPHCEGLHDYDCNGVGWRFCTSVNALLLAGASDTEACTLVRISEPGFSAGPRVDNAAWRLGCSTETYDEAAAEDMCTSHANCSAIHDYNCDGRNWRVCYDTTVSLMADFGGRGTGACTKVKPDFCACMPTWTYGGAAHTGCSETPGYDGFWCYVVGGSSCPDATESSVSASLHWRDCTDPCLCEERWVWGGETHSGCVQTPDFTYSWCYAAGGTECGIATESTVSPGRAWHVCQGSTTTTTGIAAFFTDGPHVQNDAWRGNCGTTLHSMVDAMGACYQDVDCHAIHDYGCDDKHWRVCHGIQALEEFGNGTGACTKVTIPETTTTVATTTDISDFFTEGPRVGNRAWTAECHPTWFADQHLAMEYCLNNTDCHSLHDYNCEDAAWRACGDIHDVQHAQGGTEACTMVRQPPCACAGSWTWEGQAYSGCTTTPGYHTAWCYVVGGHECGGATQSTASPLFWIECPDPCACMDSWDWQGTNFSGCNRTYDDPTLNWCFVDGGLGCGAATPSTVYEDMAWRTCVTTTTTVSTTHPRFSFVPGPRVGNAAWRGGCSAAHYNISTAMQICVEAPGCLALHDYACDEKKWRVCTAGASELEESGGGHEACTMERSTTPSTTAFGPVVLTDHFEPGPHVGNSIWFPAGCEGFERQYDDAKQVCAERGNCTALHDYDCDGLGWRICGTIEALMFQETVDTSACTMIYNDVCTCLGEWDWLGDVHHGCAETPDWLGHSWCYVIGGEQCDTGVQSTLFPSWYWLECTPPCACRDTWDYMGTTHHGCSYVDADQAHWCYVGGGYSCDSARQSEVTTGEFWRYCEATTTTMTSTTHTGIARSYVTGPRVSNRAWQAFCNEPVEWTLVALESCMHDLSCSVLHDWGCDGQHWRACRNATIEDVVGYQQPRPDYDSCTMVLKEPCACNATTFVEAGGDEWCYVLGGRACANATLSTIYDNYAWLYF